MTCYEKYITEYFLPVRGCPSDYGYTRERPENCYSISCFKDCWCKEMVEDEKVREKK